MIEVVVVKFLWKNIICMFEVPRWFISDNRRQFQSHKIRAWFTKLKIEQIFTSIAYPRANGQVEVMNRDINQALKMKLDSTQGN